MAGPHAAAAEIPELKVAAGSAAAHDTMRRMNMMPDLLPEAGLILDALNEEGGGILSVIVRDYGSAIVASCRS